jgi:hypothetical protein
MKKLLFIFCIALATPVLTACSADDNPVETSNITNPQDVVTDQPAN